MIISVHLLESSIVEQVKKTYLFISTSRCSVNKAIVKNMMFDDRLLVLISLFADKVMNI